MSFSEVIRPHMKNSEVSTISAPVYFFPWAVIRIPPRAPGADLSTSAGD
jgi:hypothetical protein